VGLDHVRWTDEHRNGVYYLEQGLGPITARVDYDRKDSAVANLGVDGELFAPLDGADAYFVCGITPALSSASRENTRLSLERAKKNGVAVFFDVNYRNKLWSPAAARETLESYIKDGLITCLITTETDARAVFGIDEGVDDDSPMEALIDRSEKTLQAFRGRYGDGCAMYLLTIRKRITNDTGQWTSAVLMPDGKYLVGDIFDYTILDRPGAGDSCSAGIIGGYLGVLPSGEIDDSRSMADRMQTGLNLGNRMSVAAQKTVGDFGPLWSAKMFFARVSEAREISR
jgi:sugar/nucleoside kinase (ribokinase family)